MLVSRWRAGGLRPTRCPQMFRHRMDARGNRPCLRRLFRPLPSRRQYPPPVLMRPRAVRQTPLRQRGAMLRRQGPAPWWQQSPNLACRRVQRLRQMPSQALARQQRAYPLACRLLRRVGRLAHRWAPIRRLRRMKRASSRLNRRWKMLRPKDAKQCNQGRAKRGQRLSASAFMPQSQASAGHAPRRVQNETQNVKRAELSAEVAVVLP